MNIIFGRSPNNFKYEKNIDAFLFDTPDNIWHAIGWDSSMNEITIETFENFMTMCYCDFEIARITYNKKVKKYLISELFEWKCFYNNNKLFICENEDFETYSYLNIHKQSIYQSNVELNSIMSGYGPTEKEHDDAVVQAKKLQRRIKADIDLYENYRAELYPIIAETRQKLKRLKSKYEIKRENAFVRAKLYDGVDSHM